MCSIELHPQSLTLILIKNKKNSCVLKRSTLVLSKREQFLLVFVVFMRQGLAMF